jgi:hypothetical protein
MKKMKYALGLVLLMMVDYASSQPNVSNVQLNSSGIVHDKFIIKFDLNQYQNPYDPDEIHVEVRFISPSGKLIKQNAFYYEGFDKLDGGVFNGPNHQFADLSGSNTEILIKNGIKHWECRFTPEEGGTWQYQIVANDANGLELYPHNEYEEFEVSEGNNKGFITMANKRYLKYTTGELYYPIGVTYPWFGRNGFRGDKEYGTNEMKFAIDQMVNNGIDVFRFHINNNESVALIGYDFNQQKNFCKHYNQESTWQLDWIIDYAKFKGVNIIITLMSHGGLGDDGNISGYMDQNGVVTNYDTINLQGQAIHGYSNGAWSLYNPYNANISLDKEPQFPDSKLDVANAYEWYSNLNSKREFKKMLTYVQARWGYATNIMAWELFDEADRVDAKNKNNSHPNYVLKPAGFESTIVTWHDEMVKHLRKIDNYEHLITTGYADLIHSTVGPVYEMMDFTQIHDYSHYQDLNNPIYAHPLGNVEELYYDRSNQYLDDYDKPHIYAEYGWVKDIYYEGHDITMYNLHNTFWSSMHNGSFGAGFVWSQFEVNRYGASDAYNGISKYVKELPRLTDQHTPHEFATETFRGNYIKDNNADEFYGWIQDQNYSYRFVSQNSPGYLLSQSTSNKPPLSTSQPLELVFHVSKLGVYRVKWYSTTGGHLYTTNSVGTNNNYTLKITMPQGLRNEKYGDAAFIVEYQCSGQWNTTYLNLNSDNDMAIGSPMAVANNGQLNYIGDDSRIHQYQWHESDQLWGNYPLNPGAPTNARKECGLAIDLADNTIFFVGIDYRIHSMKYNGSQWIESTLDVNAPANVRPKSRVVMDQVTKTIFYIGTDNRVHSYWLNNNQYDEATLNINAPQNVHSYSGLAIDNVGKVYFIGNDKKVHHYRYENGGWIEAELYYLGPQNVRITYNTISPLASADGKVFFIANDNKVHHYWYQNNHWNEAQMSNSAPANVESNSDLVANSHGKIFYTGTDNRIHHYWYGNNQWNEAAVNGYGVAGLVDSGSRLASNNGNVFYQEHQGVPMVVHYGCNTQFFKNSFDEEKDAKLKNNSKFKIYPNPNSGIFSIDIDEINAGDYIDIYNSKGELMKKIDIMSEFTFDVDIRGYASGLYIIVHHKGEQIVTSRIQLIH